MRAADRSHRYLCFGQRSSTVFLFFILLVFLQAGIYSANKQSRNFFESFQPHGPSYGAFEANRNVKHPITKLMDAAEIQFRKKLGSQSRSLAQAVNQYRHRYKRHPPQGFDKWYTFAKMHNVSLIDEFDGLNADLAPFWNISGSEFRRRVSEGAILPAVNTVRVQGGKSFILGLEQEASGRAVGFQAMLEKFVSELPDADFLINAKSESRVLAENATADSRKVDWEGTGNIWEAWRRTCSPDSAARKLFYTLRNPFVSSPKNYMDLDDTTPGRDFTFPAETSFNLNFCNQPSARYNFGHFFSDWRPIPSKYPILSPAKAQGFGDIRIPSHYYYGNTRRYTYGWDSVNLDKKDVDDMEIPWERKQNKIFWRGASTGGGSNPPGFTPQYQRQRFVRMVTNNATDNRTVTFVDLSNSKLVTVPVPISILNEDIMDVAFVKAVDPDTFPGGASTLRERHRFAEPVSLGKHYEYKYLIDLDGMSYSARFYSILSSDSVPLKATVYEEFYSDWIQPWVHFIPLSSTYKEVYNLHAYFSGPSPTMLRLANVTAYEGQYHEGDTRLRRIARAGKVWRRTMGREVDMEVYVYRLCLEYARLWSDDRDSMNFVL